MLSLSVLQGVGVPASTLSSDVTRHGERNHLLSLDSGMAAIASIIVAVGSVVDGVTVIVTHERLTSFYAAQDFRMGVPLQAHGADYVLDFGRVHPVMSHNAAGRHVVRQNYHIVVTVPA